MTRRARRPADVLRDVRDLLSMPEAWIKDDWSQTVEGTPCSPDSNRAACWCLTGAISRFDGDDSGALVIVKRVVPGGLAARFNDDPKTTHADILRVLDQAIELADKEG